MLITNFSSSEYIIYLKAIDIYEELTSHYNRLYIKSKAYDKHGNILSACNSLHNKCNGDLTIFWNIFNKLKKTKKNIPLYKIDINTIFPDLKKNTEEINLNLLSDQELINIVEELQKETFPEDSIVRKLAKQYFNNDSLTNILFVGVKILPIITERMKIYSPHINK